MARMTNKRARDIINNWMAAEGEAGVPDPALEHTEFASQALAYVRHHWGIHPARRDFADRPMACRWMRLFAGFLTGTERSTMSKELTGGDGQ